MKHLLIMVALAGCPWLAATGSAAHSQATVQQQAPPRQKASAGQELLKTANDMWFLLSGIADRKDADAAAPRFEELISQSTALASRLYDAGGQGQDLEALDMLQYRIAEAYEDLWVEFESLCRIHCYGSEKLLAAFRKAVKAGLFDDDELPELSAPKPPLTESETRHELVRLRRLVEPDRAVLETLREVTDARSAAKAIPQLNRLTARLRLLRPEKRMENRAFAATSSESAKEAYAPIAPLLWGIRSEIVRIASLPGYGKPGYDAFSEALDSVYENLAATHSAWFDDVFDSWFRSDLDDALQEHYTSSK